MSVDDLELFSENEFLRLSGDDRRMAEKILKAFVKSTPETMKQIEEEIHLMNYGETKKRVHSLKGDLGTIAALQSNKLAIELLEVLDEKKHEEIFVKFIELKKSFIGLMNIIEKVKIL